jgi:hypothetical protein
MSRAIPASAFRGLTIALVATALAVAVSGCSAGSSKVDKALAAAEAELDKSEAALKVVNEKPAAEVLEALDQLYEAHQKTLEQLTVLADEKFTRCEKERFDRVLARVRERSAQVKAATARVRQQIKRLGKE